ncbi:MAG TPA: hypothetical protein VH540_24245 [Ktedonobacterales bacterium]|jgi:hypothetical protein
MSKPGGKFAFLDDSEVVRRLGIDRKTLEQFVKEGRLRTYGGVGKGAFFKTGEVEALYAALHPEALEEPAEAAPLIEVKPARPGHDPAMRVHLRLQADLKWFDIREEDMAAWMRELSPEAYQRQRSTILQVIGKLQHIVDLIDANSDPRQPS